MPDAKDAPAGFEWDAEKAASNLAKHGVGFHQAARVWDDPRHVVLPDEKHSSDELRFYAFGEVDGNVLTVRFTPRGDKARIIGAGQWRKGRTIYARPR